MRRNRILIILSFFLFQMLNGQEDLNEVQKPDIQKRSYTTQRLLPQHEIAIDGIFQEEAWNQVNWSSDFKEWRPDNASAPTEQTQIKILYDDSNLYVAIRNFQEDPQTIENRLGRRDDAPGDWVSFHLDTYNDDRTAFAFTVSASGVKSDESISNNDNFDDSWNPIWYVKTNIDAEGWTTEMRIPLSQLRFGNNEDQVWGLQVVRKYFRNDERSTWQPIPANPPGWVSEFGILKGISGLAPQKQLEIQPYGLARLDTYEEESGNPFRDGSDTQLTTGLDAKIGVTNDLTLDVTINPDFGQVDADPGAVSLDAFEIFFQERRPFFVENKNIFDFRFANNQDNLFFSRRIGRNPQGSAVGPNVLYIDQPENTTILGAAKFSGKTKDGWTVGVLESVTSKEFADIITESGEEKEVLVEPLTNYFVGRIQKDFNNRNSFIGGIFTATHRNIEDRLDFLHTQAYSGGLDFLHNWKDRTYYLEGNTVFSQVNGSKEAITQTQRSIVHLFQREGASHVEVDPNRTSLTGTGGKLEIGKGGGGNWRYNLGGTWRSPELELNDIGFLRETDEIRQYLEVTRLFNEPTSWFRRANIEFEQFSSFDFEGNYNRIQYKVEFFTNYQNNWWTNIGGAHKPRIFINSYLRGGPRWRFNEENFFYAFVGTDNRKRVSFRGGYIHSQATQGNFGLRRYEAGIRYQPLDALNLTLDVEYSENPNKTQYVSAKNFQGMERYILGGIEQKTLSTTLRINYSINPNLSIQYYGQPFIFKADYSNFNYVTNSVAEDINDRVTWYSDNQISLEDGVYRVDENRDTETDYSFSNPDFAFVQFRSNLVARWEYIPGSEIFLVWSQGINGLGDVDNDFQAIIDNQLLRQQPRNTFLIKATYRFIL